MPANRYHFQEQWHIPGHRPDEVYRVLHNAMLLPNWWSGVYLEVVPQRAYPCPMVGAKARATARGFLPYTLTFELEARRLELDRLVEVRASGDFEGIWRAELHAEEGGTKVEIDWRVTVDKPLIRWLSPLLRPLFAWNHRWTTPRGQQGLRAYLERNRQAQPVDVSRLFPAPDPASTLDPLPAIAA